MAASVRIAIAGAGLVGARHARLVAESDDCTLAGLADPAPEAQRLAGELGTTWYPGIEALLDARGADALIVATPNQTHEAVAVAAAGHGLHLLVEKPIAHDLDSARRIVTAAEAAGVHLLVGHHRRHHVFVAEARSLIAGGAIGRLVAVTALWTLRKHDGYYADPWRLAAGGGPVLINLIHDLDMLRHLCGEIAEVRAATANAARGLGVEDSAAVVLRFENGALGTLLGSDAAPSPWNWESATGENPRIPPAGQDSYRFFGSAASLEFPSMTLWGHSGRSPGDWTLPIEARPLPSHRPRRPGPLALQLTHFVRVVRGEEPPLVSGEDALRSLAATLAVAGAAAAKGIDPRSL